MRVGLSVYEGLGLGLALKLTPNLIADARGDACGAVCVRRFRVRVRPKPYR